jgi:hypothetical protein
VFAAVFSRRDEQESEEAETINTSAQSNLIVFGLNKKVPSLSCAPCEKAGRLATGHHLKEKEKTRHGGLNTLTRGALMAAKMASTGRSPGLGMQN